MPVSVEEDLEPEKVGIVIGAKGCIISEIMKKSGAKMVINQDFPKGQPHKITFTGCAIRAADIHLNVNNFTAYYFRLLTLIPPIVLILLTFFLHL